MTTKIRFYYQDFTECMDIMYGTFGINCFDLFNAVNTENPVVMIGISMDTPPEYDPTFIETKNIDDSNKYLIDIAKKLFEYITHNEDKIEDGEENEAEIDIDPNIAERIESIEVYNVSEYDYALLFVFNLR